MSLEDKLKQIQSLTTAVRVLQIPLATAVTDREYNIAGGMIGGWLAPLATDQLTIRFNDRSADAIPFRPGLALEIPFTRVFITCPGTGAGTFYLLYGDADWVRMIVNTSDLAGTLETILAELQGDVTGEGFGAAVVGLAAAAAVAANANRKGLHVQAGLGNTAVIYFGQDNTVTIANGMALPAGQAMWVSDYRGPLWCISTAAGQRLNWFEV